MSFYDWLCILCHIVVNWEIRKKFPMICLSSLPRNFSLPFCDKPIRRYDHIPFYSDTRYIKSYVRLELKNKRVNYRTPYRPVLFRTNNFPFRMNGLGDRPRSIPKFDLYRSFHCNKLHFKIPLTYLLTGPKRKCPEFYHSPGEIDQHTIG